jgi:hypothetical protein
MITKDFFESNCLFDFISKQFPFPQTVSEVFDYLSNPKSDLFLQQFNHSVSILVDKMK